MNNRNATYTDEDLILFWKTGCKELEAANHFKVGRGSISVRRLKLGLVSHHARNAVTKVDLKTRHKKNQNYEKKKRQELTKEEQYDKSSNWYSNNKDYSKEKSKKYYKENKLKCVNYQKEYRKSDEYKLQLKQKRDLYEKLKSIGYCPRCKKKNTDKTIYCKKCIKETTK